MPMFYHLFVYIFLFVFTFCAPFEITAQQLLPSLEVKTTPTPIPASQITEASVIEKRTNAAKKLEDVRARIESATVQGATEILQRKVLLLERQDFILSQQASALQQQASLQINHKQLDEQIDRFTTDGVDGEKPFSYLFLDNQRTELKTQLEKEARIDVSIDTAKNALEQASTRLKEAQTTRRTSAEQLENNSSPLLELAHENTILDVETANEAVRLRELELSNLQLEKRMQQKRIEYLKNRIDLISQDVRFNEEELEEQKNIIDEQVKDLEGQHEAAVKELAKAAEELEQSTSKFTADKSPINTERVITAKAKHDLYTTKTGILLERKIRTGERKQIWDDRFHTVNGMADYTEMQEWLGTYNQTIEKLENEEELIKRDLAAKQSLIVTVETRIESLRDDANLIKTLETRKQHTLDEIAVLNSGLNSIETTRRLVDKLLDEIKTELNIWTWEEMYEYYRNILLQYYNYELIALENEDSISLGELCIALSIIILGLVLAGLFSKCIGYVLIKRFSVEESVVISIRALFFYTVAALLIPLSLRVIQVDLTAFAFLGGALAIGFGFGSQNIFNNFISGVILLMERPVRVGDIVEIENTTGKISRIGLRSTILTTWDNQDVVIPNSYFLENRITNFTLDNWIIRSISNVGVAYGSDTRQVQKLLRKAIDEHGLILKFPEPIVVFHQFGESSLDFRMYYWVDMKNCNRLEVDSDIRHRVHKLFNENGIEIPFPQRDLHVKPGKPLDVRVLSSEEMQTDRSQPDLQNDANSSDNQT